MSNSLTNIHPECRAGELFLANFSAEDFAALSWTTKRRGLLAYGVDGKVCMGSRLIPVFVSIEEVEERGIPHSVVLEPAFGA